MIIYKIVNSWNFDRFPNCSILKICYRSKLNTFSNLMSFEIAKFWKFFEFATLQIFVMFRIENFSNLNCKFVEFYKLDMFGILKKENFWKFPN